MEKLSTVPSPLTTGSLTTPTYRNGRAKKRSSRCAKRSGMDGRVSEAHYLLRPVPARQRTRGARPRRCAARSIFHPALVARARSCMPRSTAIATASSSSKHWRRSNQDARAPRPSWPGLCPTRGAQETAMLGLRHRGSADDPTVHGARTIVAATTFASRYARHSRRCEPAAATLALYRPRPVLVRQHGSRRVRCGGAGRVSGRAAATVRSRHARSATPRSRSNPIVRGARHKP